ncbi:MAG: hypothetical protein IKL48_01250 [Elusimicrobiaceae bacterium]|nr:hypothetical protein [Elusimicrobiaceae bacterium]
MQHPFISLDFGSGQISAVLTVYDEQTLSCRVRHALREPCPSVNGCYILDFDKTVRCLNKIFSQFQEYIDFAPTVSVGLRGDFLSFRRSAGFKPIENQDQIITSKDVQEVLDNSIPINLSEILEVVDLFAQSYTVDGNAGVQNPVGLFANCLDAETFLSLGLKTHLNNLNRVLAAAGCEDFEAVPTILALAHQLLKPEEKKGSLLLLDIGAQNSSALLYHKGIIEAAWEIPQGADIVAQEVSEVLQNELSQAKAILKDYTYGDDDVMDDLLDEAATKMLLTLRKTLILEPRYAKYAPSVVVLTGGGVGIHVKNAAQKALGIRRARLANFEHLIADGEEMLAAQYTSALALARHSQQHGGRKLSSPKEKVSGLLDRMLSKLGLNSFFF